MTKERMKALILGCLLISFSVLLYFYLIPKGIYVPQNIPYPVQSPAFFPNLITGVIAFLGSLLIIKKEKIPSDLRGKWEYKDLILIILLLVSIYILIYLFGFVLSSIAILFFFITMFGFKSWKVIIATSLLVPIIVYYFFHNLAKIQFPPGIIIEALMDYFF
jgi:hypothetical protein